MTREITTYAMSGESERLGFAIRDHSRVTRTEQPHRHEFFQMRLDLGGRTYHHIGPHRRLLEPGSLTFVLPYRMHRGGRHADSLFYVVNFHHRFLRPEQRLDPMCIDERAVERAPELAPFLFQHLMDFRLTGADLQAAREACLQMMEHSRSRGFFSAELVRANLFMLIGSICRKYERELRRLAASGVQRGLRDEPLAVVARYVAGNLAKRITLSEMADELRMSRNNVTRLLKRQTGKTFTQLLTERRLQKAQELLVNTTMRISDIGQAVGFEDNAYFARRFKQYLRMPPRVYRASPASRAVIETY